MTTIEVRHASAAVAERVRKWFDGEPFKRKVDGRSVWIPHPERPDRQLKIKGAGLAGRPFEFGPRHNSNLRQPLFDFEGRMMEDVASGHDNPHSGGASFQQAATEYEMTRILAGLGHPVVPCIGYGRLEREGKVSWFSLFEWDPAWRYVLMPHATLAEYIAVNLMNGELLLGLARTEGLIGHCWHVAAPDGSWIIKDLHPFRRADPISMSQLSWVMQLIFALHIRALAAVYFPRKFKLENVPEDIQAFPFRCALPGATRADHEHMRWTIVAPYMLGPPAEFEPAVLQRVLEANPIARALLDLTPPAYTRF